MARNAAIRRLLHFPLRGNNHGTAMLFVVVLAVLCSLVVGAVSFTSRYTVKKSGARRVQVSAFNIADAGKEQILARLRSREINPQPNQTATIYSNEPLGPGTYSVWYRTNAGNDTITILSTGKCQNDSVQIEVVATMAPDVWRKWVRGAVNTRTDITTLGTIDIDGNDYDTITAFGTPLGIGGIFGVSAGGTLTRMGASRIGGNGTASQTTLFPGVTVEQNIDTTGYPQTPEEVLGVPAGSLDIYKVSSAPPRTFYGIVYCTDTAYDIAGGILICHNDSGNAYIRNYHSHFRGLVIADSIDKFNGASCVIGAVVMLGKNSDKNKFGNGAAKIRYSSRALARVFQLLPSFGRRTVNVVSFREIR